MITELFPADDYDTSRTRALYDLVKEWDSLLVIRPYYVFKFSPLIINIKRKPIFVTNFNGLPIVNVPVFKIPLWKKYIFPNPKKFIAANNLEPDIIIGHFIIGNRMAYHFSKALNTPFTVGLHNSDISILKKRKREYKKIIESASGIICRSNSIKERFIKIFPNNKLNIYIANSGIKRDLIEPLSFFNHKLKNINKKHEIIFITAARLIPLKNIDINLIALSKLKQQNWKYFIVGDGNERKKLEALSKKLEIDDKVIFLGWLQRDEIMNLLKQADVYLQVSAPETFGLVYLEAMAKGCIVIGAKDWGIDGVITHKKNGFLALSRNILNLSNILEEHIFNKDEPEIELIYSEMFHTINQYTEKVQSMYYWEIINNILSRNY